MKRLTSPPPPFIQAVGLPQVKDVGAYHERYGDVFNGRNGQRHSASHHSPFQELPTSYREKRAVVGRQEELGTLDVRSSRYLGVWAFSFLQRSSKSYFQANLAIKINFVFYLFWPISGPDLLKEPTPNHVLL